ncbi:hypothetical protein K439DRAFT_113920 [Ramaria rubella]|nr:hypothetical protein K439DRAFT_113920 [Ramaria rubella]
MLAMDPFHGSMRVHGSVQCQAHTSPWSTIASYGFLPPSPSLQNFISRNLQSTVNRASSCLKFKDGMRLTERHPVFIYKSMCIFDILIFAFILGEKRGYTERISALDR